MLISDWCSVVFSSDLGAIDVIAQLHDQLGVRQSLGDPARRFRVGKIIGRFLTHDLPVAHILEKLLIPALSPIKLGAEVMRLRSRQENARMLLQLINDPRSEARRVGKECDSKCNYRGSPEH